MKPSSTPGSRLPLASTWVYQQRFSVSFEYPVVFTRDAFALGNLSLSNAIARASEPDLRAVVLAELQVVERTPGLFERIQRYFDARPGVTLARAPLVLPGGEAAKNNPDCEERVVRWLCQAELDRHAVVLGIGGGALLDLIGYAVSRVHRGLRLVRLPTTVLAQNDAGVGVKSGVNAMGKKNLLGCFAPPHAVVNDSNFLSTLDDRDKRAGMAEAVKVALLKDRLFFEWMEARCRELALFELDALEFMIRRCAELHLQHIATSGDPFELSSARPLDFGHWSAHKLESMSGHALRHGEAVAIGLALDCLYAVEQGWLARATGHRIVSLLYALGFALWHPALGRRRSGQPEVLHGANEFREHLGGRLTLSMLHDIGRPLQVHELEPEALERALRRLEEWSRPSLSDQATRALYRGAGAAADRPAAQ